MTANSASPKPLFYYCNFHGEGDCSGFGMDDLPGLAVDTEFTGPHGKRFVLMSAADLKNGVKTGEYYVLYLKPGHGGIPVETKALGLFMARDGVGCVPATAAELSEEGVQPGEIEEIVTSYHIENQGSDNVAIVFSLESEDCGSQTITRSTRRFVYENGHFVGKAF
jgi:hypothetical protein